MPITQHINAQITIADANSAQATFGDAMLVAAHAVNANRINGPYTSLAGVVAAGFTLVATPAIHAWASAIFRQRPRASQVFIGLIDTGENIVEALDAIEAEDPATGYAFFQTSRATADIIAMAGWIESRSKIAITQSDDADMLAGTASTAQTSTLTVGGTATDGVYSAQLFNDWTGAAVAPAVTVTRTAGAPATNDLIAAALADALEAQAAIAAITDPIADSTNTIPVTFTGLGNHYSWVLSAPAPGTLTAADTAGQVQNPGELLSDANYTRTALIYHDDDTEYLDASWGGRSLGLALEKPNGAGTWSYQRLAGIAGTRLTDPEKAELTAYNVNWYSPVRYTSGVEEEAFTFPGVATSGRFMDVNTTIDLTQARVEESSLAVKLRAAAQNRKVPFTDAGLSLYDSAWSGVFADLVKAGHYADQALSEVSGEPTPLIVMPLASSFSQAQKATRRLTGASAELVLAGAINSVGDVATVGFDILINL